MALARVNIAKDKAEFVHNLRYGDDMGQIFPNYASVIAFAAMVGFKYGKRIPLSLLSRKDPDPIPQDQFAEKLRLMDLIAVLETQDANILAKDEASRNQRAVIFQEYANGGLDVLQASLKGSNDKLSQLILLMQLERQEPILDEHSLDFLKA